MGFGATVGRIWGRLAGLEAETSAEAVGARKTSALPDGLGFGAGTVLMPFRSQRTSTALPKPTAANLRRLAETPAARRAINCIKDRIASMEWRIEERPGAAPDVAGDRTRRAAQLAAAFDRPNNLDSFRTLIEPVIEDTLVGGFGALEVELTDEGSGVRLYPVDGATIQVNPEWDGHPETPRYAQVCQPNGVAERTELLDRELVYLRLNPRSHSLFGLGKMEIARSERNAEKRVDQQLSERTEIRGQIGFERHRAVCALAEGQNAGAA